MNEDQKLCLITITWVMVVVTFLWFITGCGAISPEKHARLTDKTASATAKLIDHSCLLPEPTRFLAIQNINKKATRGVININCTSKHPYTDNLIDDSVEDAETLKNAEPVPGNPG